jgi:hypothetical protein
MPRLLYALTVLEVTRGTLTGPRGSNRSGRDTAVRRGNRGCRVSHGSPKDEAGHLLVPACSRDTPLGAASIGRSSPPTCPGSMQLREHGRLTRGAAQHRLAEGPANPRTPGGGRRWLRDTAHVSWDQALYSVESPVVPRSWPPAVARGAPVDNTTCRPPVPDRSTA